MDAWYSGLLPYYLLLPAQIALLMAHGGGRLEPAHPHRPLRRREARGSRGRCAAWRRIYFGDHGAAARQSMSPHMAPTSGATGAIPVAFHWVLALFLLVVLPGIEPVNGRHAAASRVSPSIR